MTDSLAKPANLPEPNYTPEKGGWRRLVTEDIPSDWVGGPDSLLCLCGTLISEPPPHDGEHRPIAYLAKPECICQRTGNGNLYHAVNPDCPACNRVGELDDRPEITGDPACKIASYNDCHEVAAEMGYPSLIEALEHLSELRDLPTARALGLILPDDGEK